MKILITSALPYANGPLHFGHIAGAYLPADCYARFERLRGNDVLFICGSDEYGVAITLSAELAGRTPQEHVDHFHAINRAFFEKLSISFDHFSRTTSPGHKEIVQQFFHDLLEGGYIEEKEGEQLYSTEEKRFLADRYVVGICPRCGYEEARGDECGKCGASYEAMDLKHPCSKLTGSPLTHRKTTHFYLRFDKFRKKLQAFIAERQWKPNVVHFAESYVDDLKPRAITRDLTWGVPVPSKKDKVFYVWFDAPIGYISATKEWAEKKKKPDAWKEYWQDPETKYVQFIGKDNIPFHALFFPAMIMGQKQPYKQVDDLVANEFYNLEGRQFSKSQGWYIDLEDFFKRFHPDQIRYAIAASAPEMGDAEFTWKDFQIHCNAELLGKLGNLVNRVLVFAQNNCSAKIPAQSRLEEQDHRFLNGMSRLCGEIEECYASFRIRKVSGLIMELAHLGNAYFDAKTPWKDAKDPKTRPLMETTISLCLECIKVLALTCSPIIPATAEKMWQLLGFTTPLEKKLWKEVLLSPLPEGQVLPKPYILFAKVEDEVIEEEMAKLHEMHKKAQQKQTAPLTPLKPEINFTDFEKLDLRVGLITEAHKVPKSKKLLQLVVDIGVEKRTILSGISPHYTPEQLVGKKVVVVANLKPAKLMGIKSQGMLLAASIEDKPDLITLIGPPAGAEIC